jgi:hypothetical protein
MDPVDAIRLLAKAVRVFAQKGYWNYPGVPVDLTVWESLKETQKENLAFQFGGAKDNITGHLTGGDLSLVALQAYILVRDQDLLGGYISPPYYN